jgi:hypothetical protein
MINASHFAVPAVRNLFLSKVLAHYGQHGFNAAKNMTPAELAELAAAFAAIAKAS